MVKTKLSLCADLVPLQGGGGGADRSLWTLLCLASAEEPPSSLLSCLLCSSSRTLLWEWAMKSGRDLCRASCPMKMNNSLNIHPRVRRIVSKYCSWRTFCFRLSSPAESSSGDQEPVGHRLRGAGSAAVVRYHLDVASHVARQLSQQQGKGDCVFSAPQGREMRGRRSELPARNAVLARIKPASAPAGIFTITHKWRETVIIPEFPWGHADESVSERTLELVLLLSCLWSLMLAMMAAALRASTSSGDWLDCASEKQQNVTEGQG